MIPKDYHPDVNDAQYTKEIQWISNVDFIPNEPSYYEAWPEPYKSAALEELKYRNDYFDELSQAKLKSFE